MGTILTELTYQTMYIHIKSTYKIKVGHKRCVIPLIRTPSVKLNFNLTMVILLCFNYSITAF